MAGNPDVEWGYNLAGLHHAQGRLAEAEQLLQRALEMRAKVLPASDNAIVLNLNNLAAVEHDREAWELAVQYARRASTLVVDRARRIRRPVEIDRAETFRAELSNTDSPFVWFRAAAWRLAEQQPGRLEALSEEAYEHAMALASRRVCSCSNGHRFPRRRRARPSCAITITLPRMAVLTRTSCRPFRAPIGAMPLQSRR